MSSNCIKKLTKSQLLQNIKELKKELEEKTKLAEERLNQLKYLQADFENYRKRAEKEKELIVKLANEALIKELLVILDDLDAAIKTSTEEKNKKGLLMLEDKFFKILTNHGLKKIEALGKKFNPNFHEALCREFSEKEENEVLEEIQKGYILHSEVIRPSKVKISKGLKNEKNKKKNT